MFHWSISVRYLIDTVQKLFRKPSMVKLSWKLRVIKQKMGEAK